MNPLDIDNIKSAFNQPFVLPNSAPVIKPAMPVTPSVPRFSPVYNPAPQKAPQSDPAKNIFSLVDFSKNKIERNENIYRKDFRYKTREGLKGTLKRYADREAVANLLWNKRGYGGITKDEAKFGLRNLEKQGKLSYGQVKAVRRKMGIY